MTAFDLVHSGVDYSKHSEDEAKTIFKKRWRRYLKEREQSKFSNYEQKVKVKFDHRLQGQLDRLNGVAPHVNKVKEAFEKAMKKKI